MQEEERKVAVQLAAKQIMPIKQTVIKFKARAITGAEKKFSAYHALTKVCTDLSYFATVIIWTIQINPDLNYVNEILMFVFEPGTRWC